MINIYTLTYNEAVRIQFMIDHYKSRFPNCNFTIYDNSSTDNTVEIAKKNNCKIITYESGNTLNDGLHMDMKNNCWKESETDWVLVCDLDELLDINQQELLEEESFGTTKILSEGWNMFNMEDNYDLYSIKHGVRNSMYDKCLLFNKKHISSINYGAGCHHHYPCGNVINSRKIYKLLHYKYININYVVNSYKITSTRLSQDNLRNGWGTNALMPEDEMRDAINKLKESAIKIL